MAVKVDEITLYGKPMGLSRKVRLDDITIDMALSPRRSLNQAKVKEYAEILEQMPPLVLFDGDGGKLLADGFHRFHAAQVRDWEYIECNIKHGSWWDAYVYAIKVNSQHGQPLTRVEREAAIVKLHREKKWQHKRIANATGFPWQTVQRVLAQLDIRGTTGSTFGTPVELGPHVAHAIAPLKDSQQKAELAKTAKERGWTEAEARLARQNIEDETVPQRQKELLLTGESDPMVFNEGIPVGYLSDTVAREVKKGIRKAGSLALIATLQKLLRLREFAPRQVVDDSDEDILKMAISELPKDYAQLMAIESLAREKLELPRVIEGERVIKEES